MSQKTPALPKGTKVPNHIVIIPDGDRRWARSHEVTPIDAHKAGTQNLVELLRAARQWGIHTATAWGLSTENWRNRPNREVHYLMRTITKGLEKYKKEAIKENIRLVHIGRKDRLPKYLINKIAEVEKTTKDNDGYVLNLALDYNGQDEIVRAVRKMLENKVDVQKVDEKLIDSYMDTANQPYPYPDLIVRTSGEQRTSGIMSWQSHYAEMYWDCVNFPDFSPERLKEAVVDYSRRRRRFGGNDSVSHFKFTPEVAAKFELAWWRLSKIPEGTRLREYSMNHIKEQFGLSKSLAKQATKHMVGAVVGREENDWGEAKKNLIDFYELIKEEVHLAFEPSLAASLEVKLWQEIDKSGGKKPALEGEETARKLYAEVYRMSVFQAANIAHLRVLAAFERKMAEGGFGEQHWDNAEDYLEKFYRALKDRVA